MGHVFNLHYTTLYQFILACQIIEQATPSPQTNYVQQSFCFGILYVVFASHVIEGYGIEPQF
jgi:hypothetical protein